MMAGTVLYQDRAMKQITFAPRNHLLTNTNTWTPDSQWLVFDVRPSGASFTGESIERVNIHTGEVEVIYRASQGAHVGVVTVHPKSEKYVFIHGPENAVHGSPHFPHQERVAQVGKPGVQKEFRFHSPGEAALQQELLDQQGQFRRKRFQDRIILLHGRA